MIILKLCIYIYNFNNIFMKSNYIRLFVILTIINTFHKKWQILWHQNGRFYLDA